MKVVRELYLKVPENKPPFIGICYTDSAEIANTENSSIFNSDLPIKIDLHPTKLKLDLKVYLGHSDIPIEYQVYYNQEDFLFWTLQAKNAPTINFGHVVKTNNKVEVAMADNKAIFIKADKVFVVRNHPDNSIQLT